MKSANQLLQVQIKDNINDITVWQYHYDVTESVDHYPDDDV